MSKNDYLTHMAALVRQNPSITVRELAEKLQFADGKSVYYWLEKAQYRGLRQFKRRILAEQSNSLIGRQVQQNKEIRYLQNIPVLDWNSGRERSDTSQYHFFHSKPTPQDLFCVTVATSSYFPWFAEGDCIIVDASMIPGEHSWVLLRRGGKFFIGRSDSNQFFLDPVSLHRYAKDTFKFIGVIIELQRSL